MSQQAGLHGWPLAAVITASLTFTAFVLWMTANHPDLSELKSFLTLAVGIVGRELLPRVLRYLGPVTDALGRSG